MSKGEKQLALIRGKIMKRHGNDHNAGATYVAPDGHAIPLTPYLVKQWARAVVSHVYVLCYMQFSQN